MERADDAAVSYLRRASGARAVHRGYRTRCTPQERVARECRDSTGAAGGARFVRRAGALVLAVVLCGTPAMAQVPEPRLSWEQDAASRDAAQAFTFRYYLDSAPGRVLPNVTCTGVSAVQCQAPMPGLTTGVHAVALTAGTTEESARSNTVAFISYCYFTVLYNQQTYSWTYGNRCMIWGQ
jgi:hypothetical protein